MVGEQEAANDTISDSTWVFDSYGTTSTVDDWDDDDMEEFIVRLAKKYFDGNPETLENEFQQFEKFGKLIRFAVVFCFIVLPLLVLALILFSVYKGRQAKRREYERRENAKGTAEFRFFEATLHAGELRANILLALLIALKAKSAKAASAKNPRPYNEASAKYDLRVFLLRLGWNGPMFKAPRMHLLKRMPGSAAWKDGRHDRPRANG